MRELPLPTLPLAELGLWTPQRARPRAAVASPLPVRRALPEPALKVDWARTQDDLRAAQRLRYQVFCEEMGARLSPPDWAEPGLDIDVFDDHCEHLVVRTLTGGDEVIGTYRVLTPPAARRLGCWYSDTEFDLTPLRGLQGRMAELGRSCVHADHRSGAVILALWAALASFMVRNGLDIMIGCASIPMHDGGHMAASLWERLRVTHLAAPEFQVQPRLALPVDDLRRDLEVEAPPLIKGYLRCGAKLLGPPAWDPDFNTADLPLMLRLADLPEKYRRHFGVAA